MKAGEIERLFEVERELETVVVQARSEAAAIEAAAELDRTSWERERREALEVEVAARKRDLLDAAAKQIARISEEAEARARRYELADEEVARIADRMAELVVERADK